MGNNTNIMDQLSDMLENNEGVPNNIKEMISGLKNSSTNSNIPNNSNQENNIDNNNVSNDNSSSNNDNPFNNIDIDMILKAKRIADTMSSNNDPRKSLLLSLKPYLKDEKKDKIDTYIQFLSLSKVMEEFGPELFGSGKNDK